MPKYGSLLGAKIVIDATNDVGGPVMNSLALLAEHAPTAHCHRAFCSLGWENFADSRYGDVDGDMLYSGPDGSGRQVVEDLIDDTGLRPILVGDNDHAGIVDDFTRLWFTLVSGQGMGCQLGFEILTR